MAAQENAIRTNYIKAVIEKRPDMSPLCRFCRNSNETIAHILSGCPTLAKKDYVKRHDRVGSIIHWALCRRFGITVSNQPSQHIPEKVVENGKMKLLWNFTIKTLTSIEANRPDLVLVDKSDDTALLVDFSIPHDSNIKTKSQQKITKYQPLKEEIKTLWKLRKVNIIPIIIGCLGSQTNELKEALKSLKINTLINTDLLQKEALCGTVEILKKLN
jgi:hypothetical protein